MLRATRNYPEPEPFLSAWGDLRDKLYRLLLTKWQEAQAIYKDTGEGVCHRARELWRPLETLLRLEEVPADEAKAIKDFFLESMQETQSGLSEHEEKLIETLLDMLKDEGTGVYSARDIRLKMSIETDMNEKGLETRIGNIINQMSLFDKRGGKKNGKRTYHFSYAHVLDVSNRYSGSTSEINSKTSETCGLGGKVVFSPENSHSTDDHLKNTGGTGGTVDVADDHLQVVTTEEVVHRTHSKDKDIDHMTTSTTTSEGCTHSGTCKRPFLKTLKVVQDEV